MRSRVSISDRKFLKGNIRGLEGFLLKADQSGQIPRIEAEQMDQIRRLISTEGGGSC